MVAGIVCAHFCSLSLAQVENPAAIVEFFQSASTRRVDLLLIGDSTTVYSGHGWDHGWNKAANSRFGLYATGIHSAGENGGFGAGVGYLAQTSATAGAGFSYANAPQECDDYLKSPMPPLNYLYVPSGSTVAGTGNSGMYVVPGGPLNVNSSLDFHYSFVGFPEEELSGRFQPAVRLGCSPYTNLVTAGAQSSNFGVGYRSQFLRVPAAARACALEFRWTPFSFSQGISGPFMGLYMRVEDPSKQSGMSVSTFYARGTYSARDMAADLLATNEQTIATYLSHIRQLQPDRKLVLVRISTGVNDRSEPLPSVGPVGYTPGSSPEAFAENVKAIINRVRGVWVNQGWPASELSFMITVSPPIETPDDPLLISYREQAAQIARGDARVAAFRMDQITTCEELLELGWYQSFNDRFHFNMMGFEGLSLRELDAIVYGLCPADFSKDGGVDGLDVQSFFEAWETGSTQADVNFDGAVEGADIETFFTFWSQGGC